MKSHRYWISLCCAVALLAACDQAAPEASEEDPTESAASVIPYGNPSRADAAKFTSVGAAALRQQYGTLRAELVDLVADATPTAAKDARLRRFLSRQRQLPVAPFLEQLAAHKMLELLLEQPSSNQASIGFYTRLLLENENPDADILYRAMARLRGSWSADEIAQACRLTEQRARRWAAHVCPDCSRDASGKAAANPDLERKRLAVLSGAAMLNRLVGP